MFKKFEKFEKFKKFAMFKKYEKFEMFEKFKEFFFSFRLKLTLSQSFRTLQFSTSVEVRVGISGWLVC